MLHQGSRTLSAVLAASLIVIASTVVAIAQGVKRAAVPPAAALPAPPPNPFAGFWLDHTGDGVVEIAACGPEAPERLCGRIVWLREPTDAAGRPLVDGLNEDAGLRTRPICGLPVLGSLVPKAENKYDDGWIYDPRQGKAFNVELTLLGPDRMQVMGYKGIKLLNRKFTWTKASQPPSRCPPAPRA